MKWVSDKQLESIPVVEEIIKEELSVFVEWLKKDKVREFLRAYKKKTTDTILESIPAELQSTMNEQELSAITKQMTNKLMRKAAALLNNLSSGELTNQQLNLFKQALC